MIGVYIVGGYPNIEDFRRLFRYLQNSKIDFIEVGLPFNDPVADGPVIVEALYKTIGKGITASDILNVLSKEKKSKKIYIMTYSNIIYNLNPKIFSRKFKDIIDGLIIADLPNRYHSFFYERGLEISIIPFITPVSKIEQLNDLGNMRGDFIYFVSTAGTTGLKLGDLSSLAVKVEKLREKIKNKPVFVGFGIKKKEDIGKAKEIFDGVIIGTEVVKRQHNIKLLNKYLESEIY